MSQFRLSRSSAAALELPETLRLVAESAATDLGRRRALELKPLVSAEELDLRRGRYEEVSRLAVNGPLVPAAERPLRPILQGLADGDALTGRDILDLAEVLETVATLRSRVRRADPGCPTLSGALEPVEDGRPLLSRIRSTLDRRGEIREDATPELARLRSAIRRRRESLYDELGELVREHRDHLSEETVPVRDGRLVVMLQSGSLGKVPGLVHGRSATGKSVYFEPLEVVDANNEIARARDDEAEEVQRIVSELLAALAAASPLLDAHAELVAEIDLLQAASRFADLSDARLPELGAPPELDLVQARHPLLEPRLGALREAALGTPGHRGEVVPLDLSLDRNHRVLVITGPNAGGKTVALKTAGLLCTLALCGLPIPAAAGSRIPRLGAVVATVGDEQDLLADRSTFSGRLARLGEVMEVAGPGSLVLLDELGSGTDPEEGAAIAAAAVEVVAESGALGVVTTHHATVAGEAMGLDGAFCAAMAFDRTTGEPAFRLVPGPPGASEALALARRLGLPEDFLARAERRVSAEGSRYRELLAEVERLRAELAEELDTAAKLRRRLEGERSKVAEEASRLEEERRSVGERLRRELEDFRREVRSRLGSEVDRLRREIEAGRRKGLASEAAHRALASVPEPDLPEPEDEGPLVEGAAVRHRALGWEGRLEALEEGRAEVAVRGKRLTCGADELLVVGSGGTGEAGGSQRGRRGISTPEAPSVPPELDLLGERVEPALRRVDRYLDQALLAGRNEVRIVHGHGTGRLKGAVRKHLDGHPAVASHRPGSRREGGDGATVVELAGG